MFRRAWVLAAALLCAASLDAQAGVAPRGPALDHAAGQRTPLRFFLARGDNACGPGCSAWIAAEGYFDLGSAQRLQAFVRRLGGRKVPIYFHSPGGIQAQALAIGRMLRARGMTAGVGRTVPVECAMSGAACRGASRSGGALAAELRTAEATCSSACVYALVGAAVRQVGAGARLGVHASKLVRIYRDGRVRAAAQDDLSPREQAHITSFNAELKSYLRAMGVDRSLFEAVMKVPPEQVRYLSSDEIARFGIERRHFEERR